MKKISLFLQWILSNFIGSDISNPLDSDLLDQDVLYIEMQIDGNTPLQPRQKLTSVPYAKRADVAKNIDGGVVNATENFNQWQCCLGSIRFVCRSIHPTMV